MKKKLKVGLYGYKDLIKEEKEIAYSMIETTLRCLQRKEKNKELILISSLCVERDNQMIEIAQKLGIRYDIILPSKPAPSFAHLNDSLYRAFYTTLLNSRGYSISKENIEKTIIDTCDVLIQVDLSHDKEEIPEHSIKGKRDYTIIITIKKVDEESVLNDNLTQIEKFVVMIHVYPDIYDDYKSFAKIVGKSESTVNNWERSQGIKFQQSKVRDKICEIFGLQIFVWYEDFENQVDFANALKRGEFDKEEIIISGGGDVVIDKDTIKTIVLGSTPKLIHTEEDLIKALKKENKIAYPIEDMEKKTAIFLFSLAKLLKSKEQTKEGLDLLSMIENHPSSFKYTYQNQIEHLKALFLSHSSIKEYDKAIDIYKRLYAHEYHLKEPEILTLLASNYKRKALSDFSKKNTWVDKNSVNSLYLTQAMSLYKDGYKSKPNSDKYYDAINLAYVYKIADSIELNIDELDNEDKEIAELYKELTLHWRVNDNDWWEVSSNAEFLMLLGKTDLAISNISDFLESAHDKNNSFDINATLRQLEMYLHFVDDTEGRKFYEYLVESLKGLEVELK